jgi:hypothetical protein
MGVGASTDIRGGVAASSPNGSLTVSRDVRSVVDALGLYSQTLSTAITKPAYNSLVKATALALPPSSSLNISTSRS